jgi:hypothetical protein
MRDIRRLSAAVQGVTKAVKLNYEVQHPAPPHAFLPTVSRGPVRGRADRPEGRPSAGLRARRDHCAAGAPAGGAPGA